MTQKKADIEKRKALLLNNALRRSGNPYPRAIEAATDRREQRDRDRALGLVPFAVKLPQELVRQMQAEAEKRSEPLAALVADWLRRGMKS